MLINKLLLFSLSYVNHDMYIECLFTLVTVKARQTLSKMANVVPLRRASARAALKKNSGN